MDRRSVLKGIGTLGIAGAGVGAGTFANTGQAAEVSGTFTLSNAQAVTTDTGEVEYVRVDADFQVDWDGFDQPAAKVHFRDEVVVRPNEENQSSVIYKGMSDEFDSWSPEGGNQGWGGPGEYSSGNGTEGSFHVDIDWNVLGDSSAGSASEGAARSVEDPAELLSLIEADEDGNTKTSTIVHRKRFRFFNSNDQPLTGPNSVMDGSPDDLTMEASFQTEITNQEATVTGDGDGTTGVGT